MLKLISAALIVLSSYQVTDGDTLRAGDLRIRIWGIDAPEMSTKTGTASRQAMISITASQTLVCDPQDIDRFGRTVAKCYLPNGADLACEMVHSGHAVDWPKYSGGYYAGCAE